jgi:hypothetical protein
MNMTPNLIPNADWIPCRNGLPEPNKFVWVVVGKIVQTGLARRYKKEVHMAVWDAETSHFKIYPYRLPIVSNQVWAWAQMVPPTPPITRSTEAVHQEHNPNDGEEWKDEIDDEGEEGFGDPPYDDPR